MKAIYLYSSATGKGKILKKFEYIKKRLTGIFDCLDIVKTTSEQNLLDNVDLACKEYDYLIFAGGDGTFNHVINQMMKHDRRPIIGYIPGGTINDISKNFGIPSSIKKAIDIIERKKSVAFDIGKINDSYFAYVAAIGAYADIPLSTKRAMKKQFGRMAYYHQAIRQVFKKTSVSGTITFDNQTVEFKTPFILVLNGKNVGGFLVNPSSNNKDNKVDVFLTKPGPFNGLLHYLFFKMRTVHYQSNSFEFKINRTEAWDIDGEAGPKGNVKIEIVQNAITIFSK